MPYIGKTGQADTAAVQVEEMGSRSIKNEDVRMALQQRAGNVGAFVVARHDKDRNALIRNMEQRLKSGLDDGGMDATAEKHIAAVHNQVNLAVKGWLQGLAVIGRKVVAAAAALHFGPQRCVKAEMGVGQKQYSA